MPTEPELEIHTELIICQKHTFDSVVNILKRQNLNIEWIRWGYQEEPWNQGFSVHVWLP